MKSWTDVRLQLIKSGLAYLFANEDNEDNEGHGAGSNVFHLERN